MFFNKKNTDEQRKEIRLIIWQLENLIERALNNSNNAIIAFDKSFDNLYKPADELSKTITYVAEFGNSRRYIKNNDDVLLNMERIFNNRQLQTPSILRENLKNIKKKNHNASIRFSIYHQIESGGETEDPLSSLVGEMTLRRNFRDELVQVLTLLTDFQNLFRIQFSVSSFDYVHKDRLDELSQIKNSDFDLLKLIRICEELNSSFQNGNYLSVTMLVRTLLDHVPPVFGFNTFIEIANNYGGKSLKKSLQNLQTSSRVVADAQLHGVIRNKEILPNETQVDFRNDLDVLLSEVVRVLK